MAKNKHMKHKEQKKALQSEMAPPAEAELKVEVAAPQEEATPKIDFDAWFAMRGPKIPRQHHKEIVRADFKGRGLEQCEKMEDFDAALRKYGVKLA